VTALAVLVIARWRRRGRPPDGPRPWSRRREGDGPQPAQVLRAEGDDPLPGGPPRRPAEVPRPAPAAVRRVGHA